ncbi:MAG TPA: hypothetical protein VK922_06110 [Gemmatimonadaceae bacterium]|nr:hypothetical protein [Gemmatimonadaceae bacterium]
MRKTLLLTAVLVACATNEAPEDDSAAAMADMGAATLTAADVAGTWTGESRVMDGDSITSRWTIHAMADGNAHLMLEGSTDTIAYTTTFAGDSLVAVSESYTAPDMPDTPVTFRSVGRMDGDMLRGTVEIRLASNPDSVVARERWESRRTP